MELRHLRYFRAVADESTLSAAAKRLGVAQPALTRQIHALEQELGLELLARGPKGVVPTPAGEAVLRSARRVLEEVDGAAEQSRAASGGVAGRCVICSGARALASGFVARLLTRLNARYPAIELGVTEGTLESQFRALQVGEADIGLGVAATRAFPELASETLSVSMFDAALLAESHPLASRPSVDVGELAGEVFISWSGEAAAEIRRGIRREFKRTGYAPREIRELPKVFAVSAAVAANQGWTLISNDAYGLAPPGTSVVPLTDFQVPLAHAMIYRVDEQRPVVRTVIALIRELADAEREDRQAAPAETPCGPDAQAMVPPMAPSSVLELRHLRYFCAVAEAGSFGRAAELLGLTQPALSRQVADLERVVGTPLLDRVSRGVSTTAGGDSFLREARQILARVDAIPLEAHRAHRGHVPRCVIASVPTIAARTLLTALVRECAQNRPALELELEDLTTPAQAVAIRDGHVDLGVCHASAMSADEQRGVARTRLTTDYVNCALVAESNELAFRDRLAFDDLRTLPFLFPPRSFLPGMYDDLFTVFGASGFEPRVDATYDGLQTIWALIAEDRGWGIGFASQCAVPPPGTRAVPIERLSMPWGLDLLMREDESRALILDVASTMRRIARDEG